MEGRELGDALILLARNTIGARFGVAAAPVPRDRALYEPGATFVTLMQGRELRGCIGSLEARRALSADVSANALAAAFRDPRFPPLAASEFDTTLVEVSLLSPQEPLVVADENDLARQLRPGVDGLVRRARRSSRDVSAAGLGDPARDLAVLAALKHKAGLREDFWSRDLRFARYTVTKWKEREPEAAALRP